MDPNHQTFTDFYMEVLAGRGGDMSGISTVMLAAAAALRKHPDALTADERMQARSRWFGKYVDFRAVWAQGPSALYGDNAPPQPADKHDAGKPRWSLFPLLAMDRVVAVLEFGAAKYGVGKWRGVKDPRTRYLDAAYRHIAAWRSGETRDPESQLPHLAHAICSLVFLLAVDEEETPTR